MPQVIATTVYRLEELPEGAKDRARAWYREGGFDDDWYDAVYEDFQHIADILGIRLKTRVSRLVGGRTRKIPASGSAVSGRKAMGLVGKALTPTGNPPPPICAPMRRRTRPCIASLRPCRRRNGRISTSCAPRFHIAAPIIMPSPWPSL
jgi:hypothetical protein